MLNMSQINHIRDLKKKGYKISEIHEETGVDPKTIKKYLDQSDFSPEIPIAAKKPSILDPYKDKISEYLIKKETITGKEFMKIFRAVQHGMEIPENLEELVLPEEKSDDMSVSAAESEDNLNAD